MRTLRKCPKCGYEDSSRKFRKRIVRAPKKSRMFHLDRPMPIKRWNPYHGCKYNCYGGNCWAARMAKRLRAGGMLSYVDSGIFEPRLALRELDKRFCGGQVIFVASMGDLFGPWVPDDWIRRVIGAMQRSHDDAIFFLETKNPKRYRNFPELYSMNVIFSTTIETNRDYQGISLAPPVRERYEEMKSLGDDLTKHISIEPIIDFDFSVLIEWVRDLNPRLVSVGYDNYRCGLPEPPLNKTMELINKLERFTTIERKTLRESIDREGTSARSQGVR